MSKETTTTRQTPCPAWCRHDEGHDWESSGEDLDGTFRVFRGHSGKAIEGADDDGNRWAIWLHAEEKADAVWDETTNDAEAVGPGIPGPVTISVDLPPQGADLTGDQAREYAAALLALADEWDAAEGGRS